MSPGRAWPQPTLTPADRWLPELSGIRYPACPSTYAVRPEQSNPTAVPQLLNSPPPRPQPLSGPAPDPPPPHTYGRPSAASPARRPAATAGVGAVMACPARSAGTFGPSGVVTVTGPSVAVTAAGPGRVPGVMVAGVMVAPSRWVDPKYSWNRWEKLRLP